jgi:3-oxoacyl-[acyl-carrier protein] reductase
LDKPKTALITGASRGIGAAAALALARDGFFIWLNYKSNHAEAALVADKIQSMGGQCLLVPFDVSDPAAVKAALDPLLEETTPYALVNNAGWKKDALMVWMTSEEWNDVISVHLNGFFFVTKCLLDKMIRKREGRIVTISSTSGQSGMPGQVNYAAAKSGLIGATKSLAAEVAKRNILVNIVSPGFVKTDMIEHLPMDKILPMIPMGRLGRPEEVAEVISFLCSEKASYMTGQVIAVNGGIYM